MAYEALFAETVLMRGHRGDQIDADLARPFGAGRYPGVVVIHHMPGWDGPTKEIARRFAHHGYVAISPTSTSGRGRPRRRKTAPASAPGTPSSPWTARTIASTRRWMAGSGSSPGSKSAFTDSIAHRRVP